MSTDVTLPSLLFSTVMETSNIHVHTVVYQQPSKIKSLNTSLNSYVIYLDKHQ